MDLKLPFYIMKNRGHQVSLKVILFPFPFFCLLTFAIVLLHSPKSKYICTCFYGALWNIHNGDKIFALLQSMGFLSET